MYKVINTLINIFAAPLLRALGSRLEYIILIGFPLSGVKFSTSIALDAVKVHLTTVNDGEMRKQVLLKPQGCIPQDNKFLSKSL